MQKFAVRFQFPRHDLGGSYWLTQILLSVSAAVSIVNPAKFSLRITEMSSYRFVSRRARPGIWRSAALLLLFIALNGTWVSDVAADSAQEHPNPAPPAEAAPPAEPEHQPVAAATEEVASTDEAGTPAAVEDPAPAEEQAHAGGGDDARVAESEHAAAESADSSASEQPAPPADVPEPPVETEQAPEMPVESERNPEVDSGVTEEE
eukprot:683547-Rhodomonas_salina.1